MLNVALLSLKIASSCDVEAFTAMRRGLREGVSDISGRGMRLRI